MAEQREKRDGQVNFRPSSTTRKRLADAKKAGFDKTEIINGLVENEYFFEFLKLAAEEKQNALRKLLAVAR